MMRSQSGLTLTEAMVSGAIGAIIAMIVLSVFTVQNAALSEGTANAKLQRHALAISDQIGRSVRSGYLALPVGERYATTPVWRDVANVSRVDILDIDGAVLAAYRVSGDSLEESRDASTWAVFRAGNEPTKVAEGGTFRLSEDRKEVALNLSVTTEYKGKSYSMPPAGDMYRCRTEIP
jgi:Tfp pilus assembly protein PilW